MVQIILLSSVELDGELHKASCKHLKMPVCKKTKQNPKNPKKTQTPCNLATVEDVLPCVIFVPIRQVNDLHGSTGRLFIIFCIIYLFIFLVKQSQLQSFFFFVSNYINF